MKLGVMALEICSKIVEAELDRARLSSLTSKVSVVVGTVIALLCRTAGWCTLFVLVVPVSKIDAFDSGSDGEGW